MTRKDHFAELCLGGRPY